MTQNKVDVFGSQNLEEIVGDALEEEGRSSQSFSVDEEQICIYVDSLNDGASYEVFQTLFNPEDGYVEEVPPEFRFELRRATKFVVGWGTEYTEVETAEIGGDDIREMRRKSIEESFASGYSSHKFRELYEEFAGVKVDG